MKKISTKSDCEHLEGLPPPVAAEIEKTTIADLHQIYGNSFSIDMFDEIKSETDKEIGEGENYFVRSCIESKTKIKDREKP